MTFKTLASITILALATSSVWAAHPAQSADRAFDRSFEVGKEGRLKVDAQGSAIYVTGSDSKQVVVTIRAHGNAEKLAKLQMAADRDADGVLVNVKKTDKNSGFSWGDNDPQVSIRVAIPKTYAVDLQTSGGEIEVKQLASSAVGHTSGGRISLESVHGPVKMSTSGGGVNARSLRGNVQLESSGGPIVVNEIEGELIAQTSGGGIRIEQASGSIDAETSGGGIDIDMANVTHGIVAKTSGGGITLRIPESSKVDVNASTSGGRVSTNLSLSGTQSSKQSLRGKLNGGGPELLARTSGGSINIVKR